MRNFPVAFCEGIETIRLIKRQGLISYDISRIANIIKKDDISIYLHCENVAAIAITLGKRMYGNNFRSIEMYEACIVHDLGKTLIPKSILNKKEKLTVEEWQAILKHPELGMEAARREGINNQFIMDAIMYHHEKLDGSGYPCKLTSVTIPDHVKIITVSDIFEALVSKRRYKPEIAVYDAVEELLKLALGGKVDYNVVCEMVLLVKEAS